MKTVPRRELVGLAGSRVITSSDRPRLAHSLQPGGRATDCRIQPVGAQLPFSALAPSRYLSVSGNRNSTRERLRATTQNDINLQTRISKASASFALHPNNSNDRRLPNTYGISQFGASIYTIGSGFHEPSQLECEIEKSIDGWGAWGG